MTREEAIQEIKEQKEHYEGLLREKILPAEECEKTITAFRTAIEALAAEKTGKWEDTGNFWVVYCSICGEPVLKNEHDPILRTHKFYPYCPNCGARMEE